MTAMQGALSAAERSMRSVFVGNIPYEATEEQLKDIFSEVGPVVSFRLVYDRETGKPKGYGFCEYKDQEMALSAMRNLNGYELNGRALRVDNAASEKSKEELKNLQASLGGPPVESPFGVEVSPDKAPEAISKVIASLPPEQLYELMTQMKACIENNPNEARTLLIQNPQLAYALLQAQVVMKIIEPEVATGMLHGSDGPPARLLPTPGVTQGPPVSNSQVGEITPSSLPTNEISLAFSTAVSSTPSTTNSPVNVPRTTAIPPSKPSLLGDRPPSMAAPSHLVPNIPNPFPERADLQIIGDQDLRPSLHADHDMRLQLPRMMGGDKDMRHLPIGDQDLRPLNAPLRLLENRSFSDTRFQNLLGPDMGPNNGPPFERPRPGLPLDGRPGPGLPPDGRLGPRLPPEGRPGPGLPPDGRLGPRLPPEGRPGQGLPPDGRPGPRLSHIGRAGPGLAPNGMPSPGLPSDGRTGPGLPPDRRAGLGLLPDVRPGFEGRGVAGMSPRMEGPRNIVAPPMPNVTPGRVAPNPRMTLMNSEVPLGGASPSAMSSPQPGNSPLIAAAKAIAPHDQEKAALIMQVLQLTDQQIAMLHPEQRQSIMILKEQIARSQQAS